MAQLYVSYDDLDIFLINIEGETRRKVHQGIDNWKNDSFKVLLVEQVQERRKEKWVRDEKE